MMKFVLTKKNSLFLLFLIGIIVFCAFNKVPMIDGDKRSYKILDSLVTNFKVYKRKIYFCRSNLKYKTEDVIKIYHVRKLDTLYKTQFTFYRSLYEGNYSLSSKSNIPFFKINKDEFIFTTSVSKNNFSENIFSYDKNKGEYIYKERVNYMEYDNKMRLSDTLGLKCVFKIGKSPIKIDSLIMESIFNKEFYNFENQSKNKECIYLTLKKKK